MLGNTVKTISPKTFHEGDNFMEINDEDLKTGIYLLHIISTDGSFVKKLSKEEKLTNKKIIEDIDSSQIVESSINIKINKKPRSKILLKN